MNPRMLRGALVFSSCQAHPCGASSCKQEFAWNCKAHRAVVEHTLLVAALLYWACQCSHFNENENLRDQNARSRESTGTSLTT